MAGCWQISSLGELSKNIYVVIRRDLFIFQRFSPICKCNCVRRPVRTMVHDYDWIILILKAFAYVLTIRKRHNLVLWCRWLWSMSVWVAQVIIMIYDGESCLSGSPLLCLNNLKTAQSTPVILLSRIRELVISYNRNDYIWRRRWWIIIVFVTIIILAMFNLSNMEYHRWTIIFLLPLCI